MHEQRKFLKRAACQTETLTLTEITPPSSSPLRPRVVDFLSLQGSSARTYNTEIHVAPSSHLTTSYERLIIHDQQRHTEHPLRHVLARIHRELGRHRHRRRFSTSVFVRLLSNQLWRTRIPAVSPAVSTLPTPSISVKTFASLARYQ